MNQSPLVSVIITNFNGIKYLRNCFESLYAGSYKNIEIIFVDNGSADGSLEFVHQAFKNIKTIDNKDNLGLSIASNRGAEIADGKYLFFYNNDTIADTDLISNLVKAMENDSKIGIAGCKTYTYDGKYLINAGVACDIFGYPYGKGKPFYVDAGIFIRKDLFYKIGKFDEKMFLYGEDRDICWRCWLYGYKVAVIENAKFLHNSACITRDLKQYRTNINKRFWGELNSLRSILKNYSVGFIFFILLLFMLMNLVEILAFFIKGKFKIIKYVYIKSYIENLKSIEDTLRKRKTIQQERRVSDFKIVNHMSKISGKLKLFLDMGIPKFSENVKYGNA
ncbi:MAG: glycosyltransferase family 2 protein [Candidatus Omnitrophota bacterium]|nr:glycosyltransferase family 2 protein [Candidatus Omnitrophota bacterium]